ncbi:YbcC family protein [Sneathiella limimaris]|uniref:YbcC family protein n=1 Tax=Sneathiella limimaris TaxID=1964213 RepID=UPI00146A92E1|nr:DUF2309 domain-containing protein [Sneathiella limimaris]
MTEQLTMNKAELDLCLGAANKAARSIPPAWPLSSTVAVNPYLGQADESLAMTGARLARVSGSRVTMPRKWYLKRLESGKITDADLEAARLAAPAGQRPESLEELKGHLSEPSAPQKAVPTVADLATPCLDIQCPDLVAERIGFWAAGYFDQGQALWGAPREGGAFKQWRAFATRDLTPGIIGVKGFAQHVDQAPETAAGAIVRAVQTLGLSEEALPTYFHALLMSMGGWAQYARYQLWQAELAGQSDEAIIDLLAIRLLWEEALFKLCGDAIREAWQNAKDAHSAPLEPTADQVLDVILQEAAERAEQRRLGELLAKPVAKPASDRPDLLAAFCIDVRSEVFRRALESIHPGIRTMGFAGFFGLPTSHHGFASDVSEHRLPVLLNPGLHSRADGKPQEDQQSRYGARAKRAWGRFKLAAVSSFAFVEAAGPLYFAKLGLDALGLTKSSDKIDPRPVFDPQPDLETRVETAQKVLQAMSLTQDFAPIVLLVGHGAKVVNNPHASALQCGACGGYSGEVNARLLAGLLNDPEVKAALASRGIQIPEDTHFIAALHNTTTDEVTLFEQDLEVSKSLKGLESVKSWLNKATKVTATERALRLPRAKTAKDIKRRSQDWSEVRPEWALAGCKAFIASPHGRVSGKNLEGRAFLHEYNWRQDKDFSVLELIMTAPVVVASWISLQYYGSSVSPEVFGGGNKLLHNVTGGIGVLEGNGGTLRAGLPWQSVHDGEKLMHDPLRLSVCIEAPREAMTEILKRHEAVRALFDNKWLHLFALDENGVMAWRYDGDLQWQSVDTDTLAFERRVA